MKNEEGNQEVRSGAQGLELATKGGAYSPVTVINNDTVGTVFLGLVALVLFIAFFRAQAQTRVLERRLSKSS